jgi:hypothetical protein
MRLHVAAVKEGLVLEVLMQETTVKGWPSRG